MIINMMQVSAWVLIGFSNIMSNFRKFLRDWVLPPNIIRTIYWIQSRIIPSKSTLHLHKRGANAIYLLANGPSLSKDIERHSEAIASADKLVVNYMALDSRFTVLKPNLYLLCDPRYFASDDKLECELRTKIHKLQQVMVDTVSWKMELIIPYSARGGAWESLTKINKNISILHYWDGVQFLEFADDFSGWMRNRYGPPAETVMNTAVYLGIFWRYPQIVLLGADTSFHAMIRVEQDTNRLCRLEEHFYGTEKKYLYDDFACTKPSRMCTQLRSILLVFLWYDKLRAFADWAGVKVVNASSFSWIDAFERQPASSLPEDNA